MLIPFFLCFCKKKSGRTFETIDPRTGDVIASISEGTKEDIDIAVKAARQAFDSGPWPRLPGAVCSFFQQSSLSLNHFINHLAIVYVKK